MEGGEGEIDMSGGEARVVNLSNRYIIIYPLLICLCYISPPRENNNNNNKQQQHRLLLFPVWFFIHFSTFFA